ATSDTGPRWASLSGLTTACIVWTTSEPCPFGPVSSSITLTTRPSASYSTAPGWPLTQASRREAPRILARRSRLTSMRTTGCRPAQRCPGRRPRAAPARVHPQGGRGRAERGVLVPAGGALEDRGGESLAFRPPLRGRRTVAERRSGGDALPGAGEDLPAVHLGL